MMLRPKHAMSFGTALPLEGDVYHAKRANCEIYTLIPPLKSDPGLENATVFPIPGDIGYLRLSVGQEVPREAAPRQRQHGALVDLAIFYGRNSFIFGPQGFTPLNIFATIAENLPDVVEACENIWRAGGIGERLVFRALE
jgi:hypothetical protein